MAKVGGHRINKPDGISIFKQQEMLGYFNGNLSDKATLVAHLRKAHPEYFRVALRRRGFKAQG